ncbi:three-helix bundle dimerization domain-containing protein [Streptomyces sp. NBC_01207]|uniref:three-helix bundle dimerization domain-containing protein n=1 Tax=Streptomyces sp. NBC_01207 TaxID=2903772 RepID=UPI003FA38D39
MQSSVQTAYEELRYARARTYLPVLMERRTKDLLPPSRGWTGGRASGIGSGRPSPGTLLRRAGRAPAARTRDCPRVAAAVQSK